MLQAAGPDGASGPQRAGRRGSYAGTHLVVSVDSEDPATARVATRAALDIAAIWDAHGGARSADKLEGLIRAVDLVMEDSARVDDGARPVPPSLAVVQLLDGRWLATSTGNCPSLVWRNGELARLMDLDNEAPDPIHCFDTGVIDAHPDDLVLVCTSDFLSNVGWDDLTHVLRSAAAGGVSRLARVLTTMGGACAPGAFALAGCVGAADEMIDGYTAETEA